MSAIILAILGFGLLIIVHESGHFFVAKFFGIEADEFSIGMGPQIIGKQIGRTEFSLRALPIGAFVLFADPEDEDNLEANPFVNAAPIKRLLIALAGPLANFSLALILLILLAFFSGIASNQPIVGALMPGGVAEASGLMAGDRIVKIEGHSIDTWSDITTYVAPAAEQELIVEIERKGENLTFLLTPALNDENRGVIGIASSVEKYSFLGSFSAGIGEAFGMLKEVVLGLRLLFNKEALGQLIGPIGIVSITGQMARSGLADFNWFLAFLSINLGVLNLVPIPALDGGRIILVLLEMIRGKKLNEKVEGIISTLSFVLIFGLIILVSFRDILKLY